MSNPPSSEVDKAPTRPAFKRLINGSATIHYSELPGSPPDAPLYQEWIVYRRELPRWLAEGKEGQFALIKGDQVLGIYRTHEEATAEGYRRFLMSGFMAQQILEWQPLIRTRGMR